MTCRECRFAGKGWTEGEVEKLPCRRFPPQVVMKGEGQLWSQFAIVGPNMSCGEFKPARPWWRRLGG